MCGLVGIYSSNMLNKHKDALADLLYLDTWRGKDSTGVAALRHNADTAILKATVPGYEFVEGPKLDQHLRLNDFCWIGHNRFGTVGKNIKTNAHPFQILDEDGACLIVGAHNGTLKNKHVLTDHVQFGTDSEALFNEIALNGVEEAIGKVEGAWAITYYDHDVEELRILRNKERPLFYAWEEGRKSLIWASELWMIRIVCPRRDIKLEEDKIFTFNEDTLYKFPVPLKVNQALEMERQGGLVGKTPAFFQHQTWDKSRWIGGQQQGTPAKAIQKTTPEAETSRSETPPGSAILNKTTSSGTTSLAAGDQQTKKNESGSEKPDSPSNVVPINSPKTYRGFKGVLISRKELDNQIAGGCGWCNSEFIDPDNEKFAWLAESVPVCEKCLDGSHKEEDVRKRLTH